MIKVKLSAAVIKRLDPIVSNPPYFAVVLKTQWSDGTEADIPVDFNPKTYRMLVREEYSPYPEIVREKFHIIIKTRQSENRVCSLIVNAIKRQGYQAILRGRAA